MGGSGGGIHGRYTSKTSTHFWVDVIPAGVEVFVSLSRIDRTSARISAGAPISTNLPIQAPVDSPDILPTAIRYGCVVDN